MNQRVKVRVADLIKAIEARKAEAAAEQAKAMEAYPAKVYEWQTKATKSLEAALAKVKAGKGFERIYGDSAPTKPHKDLSHYDRSLATLRMAAEDVISITADDYARYVR